MTWVLLPLLLLGTYGAAQEPGWGPPAGTHPGFRLIYTGRLFGYYRYPEIQTTSDRGCPDPATVPLGPAVAAMRDTLRQIRTPNAALVSMGEDFAPELLARDMRNLVPDSPHFGELVNKDLFSAVPSDNVGCFLRLMNFSAMVPGRSDFYFGPERLRRLANFLAEPATAPYAPVQMLAANLVIRSSLRKSNPRLPAGALRRELRDALTGPAPITFNLPSIVLPWLRSVSLSSSEGDVYDCPADGSDPQSFRLPEEHDSGCVKLPNPDRRFPEPLRPGSNHALCVVSNGVHCQLFSVEYPLLQSPQPYFVSPDEHGPTIFGILDPALVGGIGQLNDVWMNRNSKFDTGAEIVDPIESLRQVLALCKEDRNCRDRRKVLLAQMPYGKTSELAVKLQGFDVIVSQPDGEHATGTERVARGDGGDSAYVLTPGVPFRPEREQPLSTDLRRSDFYFGPGEQSFLANDVLDKPVPARDSNASCATCALNDAVARVTAHTPGDPLKTTYADLALLSMQQFCGADVALLQKRDTFSSFAKSVALWPSDFQPTAQQLLDEMLWKGDFAFCLPVKGSTLKKVLQRSADFDQQDRDDLSLEVEKGRALNTLGLRNDGGTVTIRGQTVEDNKLYGVAMTDYLAFGSTGYPEFSSEAIEPVVRLISIGKLNRLTGLACRRLPDELTKGSCQSNEIPAEAYFDAISQRPFDTSRGVTAWLELRNWALHPLPKQADEATFIAEKNATPENIVERRCLWWFTLENLSFGYNLNFIKGSDATVPGNFAGNSTFSQLATPESSVFSGWARARGGYSFPRFFDFYGSGEIKYARLAVRNSIQNGNFGPYQLTLGSNLLRGEVGVVSKPLTARFPFRLLASENVLTQFTNPFQQFTAPLACATLPCANGATVVQTFPLTKNYLVLTRVGARIQNEQSWVEGGREYGSNIDTPFSYSIQDLATPMPLECPLLEGVTLSNCVASDPLFTTQSKIIPRVRNQGVAGWFLNFHSAVPLVRSKLQLIVDGYGEAFDRRSDDTIYNTRFYEDLTVALRVPVWGNLSFAPQVETFFYQSKVLPTQLAQLNHYVFVTTSLKLDYAFDWHRGVGLMRALRFPNGVSSATSPTIPRP